MEDQKTLVCLSRSLCHNFAIDSEWPLVGNVNFDPPLLFEFKP